MSPPPAGDTPAIDVVVPVYNGARHLAICLDALLAQTWRDFRIIAVDDGSSDESPQILRDYAARDSRVLIDLAPHRGVGPTLNAGLALTTAPYIARQDHDDVSAPERFERQLAFLEANPDHIAVSNRHRVIDEEGKLLRLGWMPPPVETADPWRVPAIEPNPPHSFLMVRRDAMVAVGGYRNFDHVQDVDLYWRLLPFGRMATLPDVLGDYRVHSTSVSGLSVVQGRIQAATSQLCALSARRRAAGLPDIVVPDGLTARLTQAGTLEAILDFLSAGLTAEERRYLAAASLMKLIDYSAHRPYKLDSGDIRLLARVFPDMPFPDADNREAVRREIRGVIKGFFAGRRWSKRCFMVLRPRFARALSR